MGKKRRDGKLPDLAAWARPYYDQLRVRPAGISLLAERLGRDPSTVYRYMRLPEGRPEAVNLRSVADRILAEPPQPRTRAKIANQPVAEPEPTAEGGLATDLQTALRAIVRALRRVDAGAANAAFADLIASPAARDPRSPERSDLDRTGT